MTLSLLVDGNNHILRDWYACKDKKLSADRFSKRLELMLAQWNPSRMVAVWDSGASFRKQLDETYKAKRPGASEEVLRTIEFAQMEVIRLGIDCLSVPGFEADDIMATICEIDAAKGWKVVLSSSDKDLRQLLRANSVTQMTSWSLSQGKLACTWCTEVDLFKRFALTPAQYLDVQILAGDSTDNIRGARGIGEKTAIDLIRRAGSLDALMANVFISGRDSVRRALVEFRKEVQVARQLCTLRRDVPLPASWMEEAVA